MIQCGIHITRPVNIYSILWMRFESKFTFTGLASFNDSSLRTSFPFFMPLYLFILINCHAAGGPLHTSYTRSGGGQWGGGLSGQKKQRLASTPYILCWKILECVPRKLTKFSPCWKILECAARKLTNLSPGYKQHNFSVTQHPRDMRY